MTKPTLSKRVTFLIGLALYQSRPSRIARIFEPGIEWDRRYTTNRAPRQSIVHKLIPMICEVTTPLPAGPGSLSIPAIIVQREALLTGDHLTEAHPASAWAVNDKARLRTYFVDRNLPYGRSGMGVRLLQRTTSQITPTLDGEAYYQRCLSILAEVEDAQAAFSGDKPKGLLRVDVRGRLLGIGFFRECPSFSPIQTSKFS